MRGSKNKTESHYLMCGDGEKEVTMPEYSGWETKSRYYLARQLAKEFGSQAAAAREMRRSVTRIQQYI